MFRWRYYERLGKHGRRATEEKIEKAKARDRAEGKPERTMEQILASLNPGVEAPAPMCLPAMEAWVAASRLGRDFNGRMLYSEMRSWLDENGIRDRAQRRMYERLFMASESARAELRELQRQADEEKQAAKDNSGFAGAVKG